MTTAAQALEALMALADEARRTEAKAQLECLYGGSKAYAQQCRDEADEHRSALASAIRQHIESTAAELARMRKALEKANAQAEHFEREWYLRGDECERLASFENWLADRAGPTLHIDDVRAALNQGGK